MKNEYDFSRGTRGAVLKVPPDKTRVTIRLDNDILDWFRQQSPTLSLWMSYGGRAMTPRSHPLITIRTS